MPGAMGFREAAEAGRVWSISMGTTQINRGCRSQTAGCPQQFLRFLVRGSDASACMCKQCNDQVSCF